MRISDWSSDVCSSDLSGSSCEVADFDRPEELQPLIARTAPDVVVNAVAHTAVDRAESEPDTAFRPNAQAPGQLAAACAIRNALLVHYSTEYVFDARTTHPSRGDAPTPPPGDAAPRPHARPAAPPDRTP